MPWYIFSFICTFFIAAHLVTSKKILVFENALEFLAVLTTAQFVILFPIIPLIEIPSREAFALIIFQAIILTIGLLLQFSVLRKMPISTVAALNNLMPLFLFSYAVLILGESLTNSKMLGLFILVFGVYLIESSVKNISLKDVFLPLRKIFTSKLEQSLIIAIMLLAAVAMLDKLILSQGVTSLSLLFFSQLFLALSTFIVLWIVGRKEAVMRAYKTQGGWVLISALFKNIGNLAYFIAVSLTFVSLVLPFRQMASFVAVLVGGSIFREKNLFRKSLACLVMILGVILIIR